MLLATRKSILLLCYFLIRSYRKFEDFTIDNMSFAKTSNLRSKLLTKAVFARLPDKKDFLNDDRSDQWLLSAIRWFHQSYQRTTSFRAFKSRFISFITNGRHHIRCVRGN